MDVKNANVNHQKITDAKTEKTAQIDGKNIKLATTSSKPVQNGAKTSDTNLQSKDAKKGLFSSILGGAGKILSAVTYPIRHPLDSAKAAIRFVGAPMINRQKEPTQEEIKPKQSEEDNKIEELEEPKTPEQSIAESTEVTQEESFADEQDITTTTPTEISEKDIKESWSKSTFADRRVMWAAYNSDVKKMSPFWGKFLSWFQAIFTAKTATKQLLINRAVNANAGFVLQPTKDAQQLIKSSIEHEKAVTAGLDMLNWEIELEKKIENAITSSRNQLKHSKGLLRDMLAISMSPAATSLPAKEKSKLTQQLFSAAKKHAALRDKIANDLQNLKAQNPALYEEVRARLHK